MSALLQCFGLGKQFDGFVAARGIDLSVGRGEFVGVIGANGAGKTTLLNMISGYLRPSAGRILFDGGDVTGLAPRRLVKMGIARSFQIPQLFPRSTVLENMMLALALLVEPSSFMRSFDDRELTATARHALGSYGLHHHAAAVVGQVPQGVRKLLDIAMATCAQPKLVLLDEPTSGVSGEEKHELMRRLAERFIAAATAVIFIEHDMELVRRYASRVVALYDGEVIADGSPDAVLGAEDVVRLIAGRGKAR